MAINSYFQNIITQYLIKRSNLNKIPITSVRNVLLTVLEEKPFQKKLLAAVVPVGYRTCHYKRANKMNPLTWNFRYTWLKTEIIISKWIFGANEALRLSYNKFELKVFLCGFSIPWGCNLHPISDKAFPFHVSYHLQPFESCDTDR